jgi:hypothetical protein
MWLKDARKSNCNSSKAGGICDVANASGLQLHPTPAASHQQAIVLRRPSHYGLASSELKHTFHTKVFVSGHIAMHVLRHIISLVGLQRVVRPAYGTRRARS